VPDVVTTWRERGETIKVAGYAIWVLDVPAASEEADPLVVLHGFPSSSFDWRHVLDRLAERRRVVLFDQVGFGLSEKPNRRYSIELYADVAQGVIAHLGLERIALASHDLGDTVGGELLARILDDELDLEVTGRLITNGSIYMDLVQLTPGQELLLSLPDARWDTAALGADFDPATAYGQGLAITFSEDHQPDDEELVAQWDLAAHNDGYSLLPRTIRYIEDRRAREERYTGAIERHPSPLGILWGDQDPVARYPMAQRLAERAEGARLVTLEGIGHYPMIEAPDRFADAAVDLLDGSS